MATILALFDQDAAPVAEMTAFDRAYLGALYAGEGNVRGLSKVLDINTQLRRQAQAETSTAGE